MQGPYQQSYGFARDAAFAGLIESALDVITGLNSTKRLTQVVVGGNTNGTYRILADGEIIAEFIKAGSETVTQIRDALLGDLVADGSTTSEAVSTDTILIEDKLFGDAKVITTTTSGSTLAYTELVPPNQEIPFGYGVVADPRADLDSRKVRLPRLTGEVSGLSFRGIAAADTSRGKSAGGWPAGSELSVLRRGRIWCVSETAIAKNSQPFCRFGAGGLGLGAFRNDASGAAVQPKGLIAVTGCSAAGIFLAEFSPQT